MRLYKLGSESLWYDELLQLDIAQGAWGSILSQLPKHAGLPLDYWISHGWLWGGHSESWVRLPAVLVGTLTLAVAYQLGRSWLDRRTALLFTALLAFSPLHIRYSQEVRPYALLLLGVMLAGYGLGRLRQTGRWRYLLPLQVGGLIFGLAHFFALVIFLPWFLFTLGLALFERKRRAAWRALLALSATGLVLLLVLLTLGWGRTVWNVSWWGFGQAVVQTERFSRPAEEKPNFGTGPELTETFIKGSLLKPLGGGQSDSALRLFNGLALLGLAYLLIRGRVALGWLLSLWLILPVVVVLAFLIQRGAFFEPRYIIMVLPAYLMLVAVGLLALPRWLICAEPRGLATGVWVFLTGLVIISLVGPLHTYYREENKENWRVVGQLLAQNARPDDAVMAVNAESALNWYYPPAQAAPDQFETLAAVQARAATAERSWVVLSVYTSYIPEGQRVKTWLDEQGAVRFVVDPLIAVYYLGLTANPPQLLAEARHFALPVDHVLYAELARQNRREPAIARQYFELALANAPDEASRAGYQHEIEALPQSARPITANQ